jgi:hypothetical protein
MEHQFGHDCRQLIRFRLPLTIWNSIRISGARAVSFRANDNTTGIDDGIFR